MSIRCLFAALMFAVSSLVSAQSADQEIVSVTDSPDPVAPGDNVTYTVTLRNNGPNAATNGGVNFFWNGLVTYVSGTGPAGFTCGTFGNAGSCTAPSLASGATAVVTIVLKLDASRANFPDGSFGVGFSTSGTTADPNGANNSANVTTNWDSQQIDPGIAVTDAPDPVAPDGDITYTATVTQAGPDTATDMIFNLYQNNTLRFRSIAIPAGWSCPTLPPVGGNPTLTCTRPSMGPGSTSVFTVVLRAQADVLGGNDGSVSTVFQASGTGYDPNQGNNSETESTGYVTPDADVAVSVADSPDPVAPNGDITYTVTMSNNGPDTAPTATASFYNASGLEFRSLTAPAGFVCNPPPVGNFVNFSCSTNNFAVGATAVFTLVARATTERYGYIDRTIQSVFTAGSSIADPVNANNQEMESTAYVAPDADMAIAVTDAPDPVIAGNDITYTATMANNGPDTPPSATFSMYNNGSLRFRSITAPAGFNCSLPAVGATPVLSCTGPNFAAGQSASFIVKAWMDVDQVALHGTTVTSTFTAGSPIGEPDNANNLQSVTTSVLSDRLLSDGFE